jgi:uncharacterized membrane-anchored protein
MKSRWMPAVLAGWVLLAAQSVQAENAAEAVPAQAAEQQVQLSAEEKEYIAWAQTFVSSLNYQKGEIQLPGGVAKLKVPENFYYLSPADTERVLTEAWGNPAGSETLGMLFPDGLTPLDRGAWGVTIEYSEDGYVDDSDAKDIDYTDMLSDMQDETRAENKDRVAAGYEAIELVGWAAQPFYDEMSHKLHWAQELKFGAAEENTLNYNIRVLGRKGYLRLNFIADMEQLPEIEQNLESVLAMAEFNDGYRYDQFDPEYDKMAAYGIGGLVAGKVLAKTGFLAVALVFLKKFGVYIFFGLAFLVGKLFKRKKA